MWLMLRAAEPRDYVVATGISRTVAQFADTAFKAVGLDWREFVVQDSDLFRPTDPRDLCGNSSRVRRDLGWAPRIGFEELVEDMLVIDLKSSQRSR
jgi:GDPmannose 4,6-dehydratase